MLPNAEQSQACCLNTISLQPHHIESTPIPTHEIIQLFRIQTPAVKKQIISEMESEEYNKQLSSHIHELHFLKTIKATNRLTELYNKLLKI